MRGNHSHNGRNAFTTGAGILAFGMACIATFTMSPMLYHAVIDSAVAFGREQYGYNLDWLIKLVTGLGSALVVFGIAQVSVAVSIKLLFARIATLLFR